MKILTMGLGGLSLVAIVGAAWFWGGSLSDAQTTYAVAESAFRGFSTKIGQSATDFQAPQHLPLLNGDRMVVITWVSTARPGCRIEVDVDRRFSNARPVWLCD